MFIINFICARYTKTFMPKLMSVAFVHTDRKNGNVYILLLITYIFSMHKVIILFYFMTNKYTNNSNILYNIYFYILYITLLSLYFLYFQFLHLRKRNIFSNNRNWTNLYENKRHKKKRTIKNSTHRFVVFRYI